MSFVWITILVSAAAIAVCARHWRYGWRNLPRGWQVLALSGVALSLGGIEFIFRFWEPRSGPYLVNEWYPFGAYLNAWAVSFGFMWLAFGLLFGTAAILGPRGLALWLALLATWLIAWLPHAVIVGGFLLGGQQESTAYSDWAEDWPRSLSLWVSGLLLVGHASLSTIGFILTGRALLKGRDRVSA